MQQAELIANAALLAGIDGPYYIDPSTKLAANSLNDERFMLTFQREVTLPELVPTLQRLSMPQSSMDELVALFPSASKVLLGDDGNTTRVYLEVPSRHVGWKWNPDTGAVVITEYPGWGPPYGSPTPTLQVKQSLLVFLADHMSATRSVLSLVKLAEQLGYDALQFFQSTEDGQLKGFYLILPYGQQSCRAILDAACVSYEIPPEVSGPVLDAMTGPLSVALGVDSSGNDYLTIYHSQFLVAVP